MDDANSSDRSTYHNSHAHTAELASDFTICLYSENLTWYQESFLVTTVLHLANRVFYMQESTWPNMATDNSRGMTKLVECAILRNVAYDPAA